MERYTSSYFLPEDGNTKASSNYHSKGNAKKLKTGLPKLI
jgi:hypothetical protein